MTTLSEYAARFVGEGYEWPSFDWCGTYVRAWMEYYEMTEKKTFKITGPGDGQVLHDTDVSWYACCGHTFELSEWDMEVTFTKKVRPVEVGQWREIDTPGHEACVYVLAIHGDLAWVTDAPDRLATAYNLAWTESLGKLR